MKKLKKNSIKELENIWNEYGWVLFKNFEDYVTEVRKVEADLKKGKVALNQLKQNNDQMIQETELHFESMEENNLNEAVLN